MKKKIAFVHFGKCGGVFLSVCIQRLVARKKYAIHNSWSPPNMGRDWTPTELREFLTNQAPRQFVHNHHISWPDDVVGEYLAQGWFVFMFIRHPADLISSLYFWGRMKSRAGANPFEGAGVDPDKMAVEDFFQHALTATGFRRLWTLPAFTDKLSFVDEMSGENFERFATVYLGHPGGGVGLGQIPQNASDNPGFRALVASGAVSLKTVNALYTDEDFQEYRTWLDLWEPTLPN